MAVKFLNLNDLGNIVEKYPAITSSGPADAGRIVALNDDGKIDPSMLPDEALGEVITCTAGEALTKGDLVYLYNDNGTVKCRKAKSDDLDTIADGFVTRDYVDGYEEVKVFSEGILIRDDMTFEVGEVYFLSNTNAGKPQSTIPSGTGIIIQRIGTAISSNEIQCEIQQPVIRPVTEVDAGGANNNDVNSVDGGDASTNTTNFIDGGDASGD